MIDEDFDDDFFEDDEADDELDDCSHTNDAGEPCSCDEQECGPNGSCPDCKATWKSGKLSLVCGDHGCKCNACGATFTCP
jgi:hypothetical protein